jgi:hypothetical protein
MLKKSKFLLPIIILIIFTIFFIGISILTNFKDINTKESNLQKIDKKEILKQEEDATQEKNIEEASIIQEANMQDTQDTEGQETVDIQTLTQEGKIDLSPLVEEDEPEFADVELLRLDDKLLEKKLIHYMNSLSGVVQYKIEKNRKSLEVAHEKIMLNIEQITEQHNLIDKNIQRQSNFQILYERHLETMDKTIVFLSIIGLIIAFLIYYIWRSIVNVNKNEGEVISLAENMNRRITELKNEIETLKKQIE